MTPNFQIFLHDIHHHGELGEYQHSVAVALHFGKEIIEDPELARVTDLVISQTKMFDTLKQNHQLLGLVFDPNLSYSVGLTGFIDLKV